MLCLIFAPKVDSIIDVGAPAYGQLQKLKGQSLDTADAPKKNVSAKIIYIIIILFSLFFFFAACSLSPSQPACCF